jgi:hypothetical protein
MNNAFLLAHEPAIAHGFFPASGLLLYGMFTTLCHDIALVGVSCMAHAIELGQQAVFHCTAWFWEKGF